MTTQVCILFLSCRPLPPLHMGAGLFETAVRVGNRPTRFQMLNLYCLTAITIPSNSFGRKQWGIIWNLSSEGSSTLIMTFCRHLTQHCCCRTVSGLVVPLAPSVAWTGNPQHGQQLALHITLSRCDDTHSVQTEEMNTEAAVTGGRCKGFIPVASSDFLTSVDHANTPRVRP